jgi:phage gp29-like protein
MAVLYDQFGREIRAREQRRPETREISVAQIRDRWSTYPSSGLTPVRLAQIFKEADNGDVLRQAELFEEMEEKDAHLASQFQTRKLAVQGLGWEILPAKEGSEAKRASEFCTEVLQRIDLDDVVLDLLDALAKGYSVAEILWEIEGREARVRDVRWVHPKKVTFWNSMTPRVLTEEKPVEGIDPPPWKFVYHRYKARSGHDTRAGILRVVGWMYLFKNYAIKDWVAFAEVYGMPLRLGKYDVGASPQDKEALLQAIRSLGSDAAGIISKNTEIEFVEAQRTGTLDIFNSLTGFCDAQMSKAILGQTLTSEAGGTEGQGSYALGKVHADVRQDLVEADCKALGKTITAQILRPLVGFNYGWEVPVPEFRFLYEPPEDLKPVAETYKVIVDMGFPLSAEHVSERFKIPMMQEGETPLAPSARSEFGVRSEERASRLRSGASSLEERPPRGLEARVLASNDPASAGEWSSSERSERSFGERSDPGQAAIDELVERLTADGRELDPLLEPVLAKVAEASSFEEILERLYDMYPRLDTSRMEELIRQATFAADVWGYLRAREGSE